MLLLAGAALMLSVVVTFLAYRLINQRMQPPEEMTKIVVVTRKVSLGTRLERADVQAAAWPKTISLQGSFRDLAEVLGRGVIVPMEPNEPVLEAKLAPINAGAGLMIAIPDGMRAVSVKVNDVIGVAGFVVPGARIDVILSGTPPANGGGANDVARVILENVQVLAAGQNVDRDVSGKPVSAQVITLLVTPEDSERLALVTAEGRIHLALRNPLDLESAHPRPVKRSELYTGATGAPEAGPAASVLAAAAAAAAPKPVVKAPPKQETAAVVAAAPPPVIQPAPPEFVDVQLIQGTTTQVFKFVKKPE